MYKAEENIANAHFQEEGHDYGVSKRMAAYPFLAKYLNLDLSRVTDENGKVDESFLKVETQEEMMVFNGKYPAGSVPPNTPLK